MAETVTSSSSPTLKKEQDLILNDTQEEPLMNELTNPTEIPSNSSDEQVRKLLNKSIALQLKPLNLELSQLAFNELSLLVNDQLDFLISELHRMSVIQRRNAAAKTDIELLLRGLNLNMSELHYQLQVSNFMKSKNGKDYDTLIKDSSTIFDSSDTMANPGHDSMVNNPSNILIKPNNPFEISIPNWLPAFPPDHTYKFTPQFNKPITDQVLIKQKLIEEGKKSEKSLLNLLNDITEQSSIENEETSNFDSELARKENIAIYGYDAMSRKKRKPPHLISIHDTEQNFFNHPQGSKHFNVGNYAHFRVELTRKRVEEFELEQLKWEKNPFLRLSRMINDKKVSRSDLKLEIKNSLQRSYKSIFRNYPKLKQERDRRLELARQKREEKIEKLKIQNEQLKKDRDAQLLAALSMETSGENTKTESNLTGVNDQKLNEFSTIATNIEDVEDDGIGLFGDLESSDEDNDDKVNNTNTSIDNNNILPVDGTPDNETASVASNIIAVAPNQPEEIISSVSDSINENVTLKNPNEPKHTESDDSGTFDDQNFLFQDVATSEIDKLNNGNDTIV